MIQVKEEFKNLIPALSAEEYAQLEANILEDGIREPIITWNGFIIDGHNRFSIAQRFDLEYRTTSKHFSNDNLVKIWMLDNQFGKRNLTDAQRYLNRNEKRKLLKAQGKKKQIQTLKQGNKTPDLSTIDKTETHNTRKEIANELGWSTGKVAMADVVFKKATPEVIEKVNKSEVSINAAYKEIKKEEKKEERIQLINKQIEEIEAGELPELKGLFDVISVDPPWNYEGENKNKTSFDSVGRRVANPYPEMSTKEIKKIELPLMNDSIVFLWTTHKFLPDALDILKEWNLEYKGTLVWNKEKMGMGAWFRMQCEFCLVGIKGNPYWENTKYRDILNESRRQHSRKPDSFFTMVEEITIGRRLEYFSREKRNGWEVFGNDINKF
jgi:N6-adenosine-specific RNA methylase IME4